jgi:hypothetical protein
MKTGTEMEENCPCTPQTPPVIEPRPRRWEVSYQTPCPVVSIHYTFGRLRVRTRSLSVVNKTKHFQVQSTSILKSYGPVNIVP